MCRNGVLTASPNPRLVVPNNVGGELQQSVLAEQSVSRPAEWQRPGQPTSASFSQVTKSYPRRLCECCLDDDQAACLTRVSLSPQIFTLIRSHSPTRRQDPQPAVGASLLSSLISC